jgi:ubiquinone/menaquinone biosynthesis C-methylase UbiE
LEHTQDPAKVLSESIRVLKHGGIAHIITPNYWSYFDGHYAAFHPPIFSNRFFCWWISTVYGKDPQFAATIRTELNPRWVAKQLSIISSITPIEVIGMGENTFKERMKNAHTGNWMALSKLQRILVFTKKFKLNWLAAIIIIMLKGWTPLIISVKKT